MRTDLKCIELSDAAKETKERIMVLTKKYGEDIKNICEDEEIADGIIELILELVDVTYDYAYTRGLYDEFKSSRKKNKRILQ